MPELALPEPTFARTVRGTGPGLLLAHGAGGSIAANYGPILNGLAAEHTVVGVDYPGTGDTPRSASPLSLDELADQVVAAGVAEGLGSFAVAGYSVGTAVALRAATRHPERVTALLLTAPFAQPDARLRLSANLWRDLHVSGDHAQLASFLILATLSPSALEAVPANDLGAVLHAAAQTLPPGTAEHAELTARIDVRADLARVSVPTLVISTTEDLLVSPALHRTVATGIAGAELAELATGHLPFSERPDEWLQLIAAFLRKTAQQDGS
ncbi:alpha/beta fold hydrolase [Streptomyces sp. NPDC048644]|uniref:alpha/beta fold hydrolase n=1 Tax=Streptomyces sp. NPDC048644 TaxID=3365582 RepID=UPI00371F5B41